MRLILALCAGLALSPAGAQEAVVTLPTLPALAPGEAGHLLRVLVHASVAAANCPGAAETAAPHLLLNGTLDALVDRLAMDGAALERVLAPVLAAVDKPGFCATEAARIGPVLTMLVFWGGSLTLIRG